MHVGPTQQGYTIVEVMIFLGVSGALFGSAVLLLSGQQGKTEFTQAVRETQSQIQDVINDTSTGYYPSANNIECDAPSSSDPPNPRAGANKLGTNQDCIFIGRVLHFGVAGTDSQGLNVYTVVGRRQVQSGAAAIEAQNFDQARPTAIPPNITPDERRLQNGLKVKKMSLGGTGPQIGAVGFFSSFGQYAGADLLSGAQTAIDLVPVDGSALGQSAVDTVGAINRISSSTPSINPVGGVVICLESGSTKQFGIIAIGGGGRQLSTTVRIVDAATAPPECL